MLLRILSALLLVGMIESCHLLTEAVPPIDWVQPDEPEPVQNDTCELVLYTEPEFVSAQTYTDISNPLWYINGLGWESYDICELLTAYYGLPCQSFERNGNWFVVVTGTNLYSFWNMSIFRIDATGDGVESSLSFAKQSFVGAGRACEYSELVTLSKTLPSVDNWVIHGNNCTPEQLDTLVSIQCDSCKLGRYRIDLRATGADSLQAVKCAESGWQNVVK